MVDVRTVRVPRGAVAGAVLLFLVVAAGTILWWISHVADRQWGQARRRAQSLQDDLPPYDGRRTVLYGDVEQGNAWDDYRPALDAVAKFPDKDLIARRAYREAGKGQSRVMLTLAKQAKILELVRRGTHRATAFWDYKWENGPDTEVPPWERIQDLVEIEIAYAWLKLQFGTTKVAAEALLDALQLVRDSFAGASTTQAYYSLQWTNTLCSEIFDFMVSGKAKPVDLGLLDRGLERFNESFPNLQRLVHAEGVCATQTLLKTRSDLSDSWRYGFSYRIQASDAVDLISRAVNDSAGCDDQPWSDVERRRAESERRCGENPAVDFVYPEFRFGVVRTWRETRTQFRLLRMGAHFLATGEVLPMQDPMGARMLTKLDGRTLTAWSVGLDGVDDGGTDERKDSILRVTRP